MAIKINGEETPYQPSDSLKEVLEDLEFFKSMAERNKDKLEVFEATKRVIDILTEQKMRILDEGEI